MKIKNLAVENYKRFCLLDGSDYIASQFALESILRLVAMYKIKSILELGLGIGSVSDTVLKFADQNNININYFGTENNDFCLKVLPKNVENFKNIKLYSELKEIENQKFDLIIIDGSDESLTKVKEYCNKNTILYIEGDRKSQTKIALNLFPNSLFVNVITLAKNPEYAHESRSVESYIGGGQLIYTNPTLKMRILWFKEKVLSFFIIKIRIFNYKRPS